MQVLITIFNGFFTVLQVLLGAAIIIIPFLTLRKPAEQTKKFMILLSIGAAGVLILSSGIGLITQFITLSSLGALSGANIVSILLSSVVGLFGTIFTVAFPALANMMKKVIKPLVFLLIIPVILAVVVIVNSAAGFSLILPNGAGTIVPGILCGLLLIAALVLFTVWYLVFSSNRTCTTVVMIALPIIFVLCFILSMVGSVQICTSIGMAAGILNSMNFRAQMFSNPMCMLLLLLFAMVVREFGLQKSAQAVPYQPSPYYPQN